MEFITCNKRDKYILSVKGVTSTFLHCCRLTGRLSVLEVPPTNDDTYSCLGTVYAVLGTLKLTDSIPAHLFVVTKKSTVLRHPLTGANVYQIDQVQAIPLSDTRDASRDIFARCPEHAGNPGGLSGKSMFMGGVKAGQAMQKAGRKLLASTHDSFNQISSSLRNKVNASSSFGGQTSQRTKTTQDDDVDDSANDGSTALAEILRLLNEPGSYFYAEPGSDTDLTNSLQHIAMHPLKKPAWDTTFFWNRHMLRDLVVEEAHSDGRKLVHRPITDSASFWVTPIICGYVGSENCNLPVNYAHTIPLESGTPSSSLTKFPVEISLISRRSVRRAGTRYIKRGINDEGSVANFVESELVLNMASHTLSFVQIRGSVPIFYSQPGYKYRPPPKIDRSFQQTHLPFEKHFHYLIERYGKKVVIVNLVEQQGRESVLFDEFLNHIIGYDSDELSYVAFDFHQRCRAMRLDNLTLLLETLRDPMQYMRFCWIDKKQDVASEQRGVIRVNCVDCLDRTNVVQTAIARQVLMQMIGKMGLLGPDEPVPVAVQQSLQRIWADQGDALSRQYTGTAALKGDLTRTGQRGLVGLVKDGYNSANRYYLCHVKDTKRQMAMDLVLGKRAVLTQEKIDQMENELSTQAATEIEAARTEWLQQKDEFMKTLVHDCQRLFLPEDEILLAGWTLIDISDLPWSSAISFTIDNSNQAEMDDTDCDTVLLLTKTVLFVGHFDDVDDKFTVCNRIALDSLELLEVGPMKQHQVFKLGKPQGAVDLHAACIKITFRYQDHKEPFFFCWRIGSTRLFNNLAIAIRNPEEAYEYAAAIGIQIATAYLMLTGNELTMRRDTPIRRQKWKPLPDEGSASPSRRLGRQLFNGFPSGSFKRGETSSARSSKPSVGRSDKSPQRFSFRGSGRNKNKDKDKDRMTGGTGFDSDNSSLAADESYHLPQITTPRRSREQTDLEDDRFELSSPVLFSSECGLIMLPENLHLNTTTLGDDAVSIDPNMTRFRDDSLIETRPRPTKVSLISLYLNGERRSLSSVHSSTLATPLSFGTPPTVFNIVPPSDDNFIPIDLSPLVRSNVVRSNRDVSVRDSVESSDVLNNSDLGYESAMKMSHSESSLKKLNNNGGGGSLKENSFVDKLAVFAGLNSSLKMSPNISPSSSSSRLTQAVINEEKLAAYKSQISTCKCSIILL